MTIEQFQEVRSLFESGCSLRKIQQMTGVNRKQISAMFRKADIELPRRESKVVNIAKAKYDYNSPEVDKMIADYSKGTVSFKDLEAEYGISRSTICRIFKYKGVIADRTSAIYTCNESAFDFIDTEEKAYWLGFLYADGCVMNHTTYILEIGLSSIDREHLEKFVAFMGSNSPIKDKEVTLNGKTYKACRVQICNKKLVNSLIRVGCVPDKSLIASFPRLPDHLIPHFMRGYFDGDGSVGCGRGQLHFSVIGTDEFLAVYDSYLNSAGVNKTKHGRSGNAYNSNHNGNRQCAKIFSYLYKDATIYLERKFVKFTAVLT